MSAASEGDMAVMEDVLSDEEEDVALKDLANKNRDTEMGSNGDEAMDEALSNEDDVPLKELGAKQQDPEMGEENDGLFDDSEWKDVYMSSPTIDEITKHPEVVNEEVKDKREIDQVPASVAVQLLEDDESSDQDSVTFNVEKHQRGKKPHQEKKKIMQQRMKPKIISSHNVQHLKPQLLFLHQLMPEACLEWKIMIWKIPDQICLIHSHSQVPRDLKEHQLIANLQRMMMMVERI